MKILICWNDVTGYSTACWKSLAKHPQVQLQVIVFDPCKHKGYSFQSSLLKGCKYHLIDKEDPNNESRVASLAIAFQPDIILIPGWLYPPYNQLAQNPALRRTQFIMGMDNPWTGTARQHLARFYLHSHLKRMAGILVAGERSWQYARKLGFGQESIFRGLYGFDYPQFAPVLEQRLDRWPKRFLFVGRYIPLKGFDVMLPAYRKYRAAVSEPWQFTFCGQGPMAKEIDAEPGAEDWGFVQPDQLPSVMSQHGAFIMASWKDHFNVALAEAMATGLPAIVSEEVGALVDLVRNCYNGIIVPTHHVDAMASAMLWMHHNYDRLPAMGRNAREFAAAFGADVWADRVVRMIQLISGKGYSPCVAGESSVTTVLEPNMSRRSSNSYVVSS